MVGNVYSTYELAKEKAEYKMKELEQDIFICHSRYKSGEEFILKTRDQVSGDYLYMAELPFRHRFKNKTNADREADMFASKKGKPVYAKKKTKIVSGYVILQYYFLTYKEPCLT